jgi:DNA-binding MarR family transcriptional regulator
VNDPRVAPTRETARPEDFALETFLPYRLSLLSNTVSEGIASAYRDQHGLTVTEWRVLAILGRYAGITASEITERGAMDKVTVSRAVGRLDDKGLVKRTAQHDDRRRVALALTRSGVRLFNQVVPDALAYERRLLDTLTAAERSQLDALLEKLLVSARLIDRPAGS